MIVQPPLADLSPDVEARLPAPGTRTGRMARALLRRFAVWPVVAFLAQKTVPQHRHTAWYSMGGIALLFFVVQIATGILLMVYYRPSQPWQSVQRIVSEVPFGNLVRSVHHWAANLMVLALFLHLFSTFFMKAYRRPREATWISGLCLFGLSLAFGFSGYLLPWDELSFSATRVGISEIERIPGVGAWLAALARGGSDVTVDTIGRFYALHVVVLPLTLLGLLGLHLTLVQIQGVSAPDSHLAQPPEKRREVSFFGEFLVSEIPVWLFLLALLGALAAFLPRALAPEADSTAAAPAGIKPEWYFLSQYQALKLLPGKFEVFGQMLFALLPALAFAVPFLDHSVPADRRGRMVTLAGLVALAGLLIMTLWGWLS